MGDFDGRGMFGLPADPSGRRRETTVQRRTACAVTALATALVAAGPGQAQSASAGAPASAAASPDTGDRVQEIVVTAQRREENLQRVPISVTAVTGATLARANITSTASLAQVTPALTWSTFGRSAFPYIRGIGTPDTSVGNESSVATYVDGIYIESTPAAVLELNNVERIEVLKGPQGTLFGRNATGGLIQIITRTPSRAPGGNFEVGYANYETVRTSGYLTGPLTGDIAADLAVTYSNQNDGWGRNVTLGRKIDTGRTFAARSKILFDLGATRFVLGGDYTYQGTDIGAERNLVAGVRGRTTTPASAATSVASLPGYYDSQSNIYPFGTLRTGGVNLRGEHDLGGAKLISITSYRRTHLLTSFDIDETAGNVQGAFISQQVRAVTQELQLASQGNGAFRWIIGGFFMHRNGFQPYETLVGTSLPPFLPVAGAAVNGLAPVGGRITLRNGVKTDTAAPYAQATLRLGEGTEITAGARYTYEHQRYRGTQETASGVIVSAPPKIPTITFKKPTWRLAVNQRVADNFMAYVSYNRGFKSGVYNTNAAVDPPVKPEVVDAYEAGFKSELFDKRLRVNVAAYQSDYRDIQLNVATGNPASPTRALNAGRARIRGVEGSIDAVPVRGITLGLGANYMPTAKYTTFLGAPFFQASAGGGSSGPISFDDSGGRMIRAPKFTGTISASYTFAVAHGDLDLGVNYYHSSHFLWNVDDLDVTLPTTPPAAHLRARYQQANYSTVNGQIQYKDRSGLMVAVWGRNLTDKKYNAGLSESGVGDAYIPAAPRTYGVKVGYSF